MKKILVVSLLLCSRMVVSAESQTRASILQTDVVPYLIEQDCSTQFNSVNDELVQAQADLAAAKNLINDSAIPDASSIDAIISDLFDYTPTTIDSLPTDPLVARIQNGLLPYLEADLVKLGDLTKIVKISAGFEHLVVLTEAGKVYGTGFNFDGELGVGDTFNRSRLTPMEGEGTSGVTDISAGYYHTVIVKGDKVYATGDNTYGQLGIGTSGDSKTTLTPMAGEGMSGVTAIAGGGYQTLVLKGDVVWGTGDNSNGQLGLGGGSPSEVHVLTAMVGEGASGVGALAAGEYSTFIIKSSTGAVYACGIASDGRLGIGFSTPTVVTPTSMAGEGALGVDAVAAGQYHTVILKNGSTYATGQNGSGQLGLGTTGANVLSPTAMLGEGGSGVTAIAAGDYHSVILKGDKAYAVGKNSRGQLGIGTLVFDPVTTLTAMLGEGLSGLTAISAGQEYTVALKNTQVAYATGYNNFGELGIGSRSDTSLLTEVKRPLL